uniref:phosphoethanolamine N-methyltransferase n=1 Tax=Ascaris lumbricoides TaxID=6252 RepID=A0A9J2PD26_ASCLU
MTTAQAEAYLFEWPESERLKKVLHGDSPKLDQCYTMPGVKANSTLSDAVAISAEQFFNKTILRPDVPLSEDSLRQLIADGHLRAAVNLTAALLTTMQQGVGMAGQPSKNTIQSLKVKSLWQMSYGIWACRFQLLMALKLYTLLNDELLPFEELDAPDLYFQYYPTVYIDGRKGSLVPFTLRLIHAESLRFTPYPWATTKRIDVLEDNVQKVIKSLKERELPAEQLDVWKQRLLAVQKIRARTLFFLKASFHEYSTSISLYNRIAAQEDDEERRLAIKLMLARMTLSIGSEKEAERYFKDVASLCGDQLQLYKALRCIFYGSYAQAYEHLQKIASVAEKNPKVINNTAVCLLYIGRPADALNVLSSENDVPNEPTCINFVSIAELATCDVKQRRRSDAAIAFLINVHQGGAANYAAINGEMPAAERELISALFDVTPKDAITSVLLVTSAQSEERSLCFVATLNEQSVAQTPTHFIYSNSSLVALFEDRAINLINKPSDLDTFVASALKALKEEGVLIVREDLNGCSACEKVAQLTHFFDLFRTTLNGVTIGFKFYSLKQVNASIHTEGNFLDVFWILRKECFEALDENQKTKTFRDFLDTTQYTDESIRAYEWIFGDNFISPGGYDENLEVLKRFGDLKPDCKMLDIGVGIGGGARQAAREFGALVLGMDISANMLSIAMDRLQNEKDTRVRYQISDALEYEFPANSFDYVFSRDGLHHNERIDIVMRKIFGTFQHWLKPGGKVLITVYGMGHGTLSAKFQAYVEKRKYFLKTLEEMVEITEAAGFENVQGTNLTKRFRDILLDERTKTLNRKNEFLEKFDEGTFNSLLNGWNDKIGFIDDDNHNWNQIFATKPL